MNYKDTLLMPKTSFDMRGNLTIKDGQYIKKEIELDIFKKLNDLNQNKPKFILHDGPPYANGDIHVGHALNKILKDIIVRRNAINGFSVEWILGWDTHGLPIESALQKEGKVNRDTSKVEALKLFRNYALKQQQKQLKQFKQLALFTNFNNTYLTLESKYVSKEIEVFHKMLNNNIVYQDLKPVYWSWSSYTALAEAEVEYKEIESKSIYVEFEIESNLSALIWTTTPWTLLANVAIAFGEKISYSIYKLNKKQYIIADDLLKDIESKINQKMEFVSKFNVEKYLNKFAINPINQSQSKILYGHHVNTTSGTGIVHIAGGHGEDDFKIVKENNLKLFVVLDELGKIINSNQYDGMFYKEAEIKIIEALKNNQKLLFLFKFNHSYPHDWRTKEPIVFLATKQWFVSLDKIKKELLNEIKSVKWEPKWGENRLNKMISERNDWCISRQRSWGVPIPIIFDEFNKPIINDSLQKEIQKRFLENGIVFWHNLDIKELVESVGIKYNSNFRKETDILDVWFDSGSSNYALYSESDIDLIVEGTDQYRGWFNSSLIIGHIMKNRSPYKSVLSHGFVNDKDGQKMSKSIGNVIDPLEIISQHGIDILRLWVAKSDFKDNLKISNEIIEQVINDYKKIRNTIRFILGNTSQTKIEGEVSLGLIDKIVLTKLNILNKNVNKKFNEYNFNNLLKELITELSTGFISYYLDYAKDILYTDSQYSSSRKGIVYVLKIILDWLYFVMAPFIPVTIDEAFTISNGGDSVFLKEFDFEFLNQFQAINESKELFLLKDEVNKAIENLRKEKLITSSLEVELEIKIPKEFIMKDEEVYKNAFMVSKVNLKEAQKLEIKAFKRLNAVKCLRCWKYFNKEEMQDEICLKCSNVVAQKK